MQGTYLHRSPRFATLVAFTCYLALSLVKMRAYALDGRFWAEEATHFYAGLQHATFVEAATFVFNGHVEWLTSIIVWWSAQVPLLHGPQWTTWLSWSAQTLPVCLVLLHRDQFHLSLPRAVCWLIVVAGLPQAAEVWANSINLHFHFALAAAILCALKVQESSGAKWLVRVILVVCGLSGIPANFLVPVFAWRAWTERTRERWVQTGLLCVTAALQVATLASHAFDAGHRGLPHDPFLYVLIMEGQHLVAPLLSSPKLLSDRLTLALSGDAAGLALSALLGGVAAVVLHAVWRAREARVMTLVVCGLVLSTMGILTSLGDPRLMIDAHQGSRYFFASNALFALAFLTWRAPAAQSRPVQLVIALLVVVSAVHVPRYISGPNWREAHMRAIQQGADRIDVWPSGWHMPIGGALRPGQ